MQKVALKVSGMIFLLVALAHLVRVFFKVEVLVNGFALPVWLSIGGFLFALGLALWMFKLARQEEA